jgi:DNA-binding NtrC family response regulator
MKPLRAMIVDDNIRMAEVLAEMLEVFNLETITVQDGETALRSLNEEPISLVITDLRMPKMTGVELLRSIKAQNPDVSVVVISGYNLEPEDDQYVKEIAQGFLKKPFKMEQIQELLSNIKSS